MTKKLKRPLAFLSAFVMVMALLLYFPSGTFSNIDWGIKASAATTITPSRPSGSGTSTSPYKIGTAAQLYWFAGLVNGTISGVAQNKSAYAELTANIVVNKNVLSAEGELNSGDFTSWTPIGDYTNYSSEYAGEFNGNGYTVSGLCFDGKDTSYVGLFGRINSSGKISNVGVVDSYFKGSEDVGGVCGNNFSGTITNCYNTGTVIGESAFVGGVCGENNGKITGCYNTGKKISGSSEVGGVCGLNNGAIAKCYNTGSISTPWQSGGVCGYNENGSISYCYNTGTVSGTNDVGGVC